MRFTGHLCPTSRCFGNGVHEYGGLCGSCWKDLSDQKRRALVPTYGDGPVVRRTIRPGWDRVAGILIGFAAGFAGSAAFHLLSRWLGF
jgi:hypothetical protein